MLTVGCILSAMLMVALPRSDAVIPIIVALGMVFGLPAGADDEPPGARPAPRDTRDRHGHFLHVYYGTMMLGPAVGGALAKWTGSAAITLDFGAVLLLVCPVLLLGGLTGFRGSLRPQRECPPSLTAH